MLKTIRLIAWLSSGCVAAALLTLPVSVQAQLALSVAIIVSMLAIWFAGQGRFARWSFLALGSMVVCRYIFWRATSTLPPIDQPLNFTLGLLLVGAELYCVLILFISLVINADPLERPALARSGDHEQPTVDLFIPTYNEDEFILATTISAAKLLDYPSEKLTVWLLDDGGTDQKCADADPVKAAAAKARRKSLQTLCDALGARYLTRARNEHAKAGNLNNGLKHSTGAIIGVFDADHAPFRSFLQATIGHFALDPKLFLVQTPHVFLNPDPIERNLKTFQSMPSENEMFYSVTQRGLDKWNGSFFCGSAALLRREALDVVGGFSGITITEDCETAFELHSKGWTSVYVDKPMIAGLQPETFESFIGQRSRWCQGMFQLLLLKNPLFGKGLAPIQKIAYLSSMVFWLFPLPRLIFTVAPLLHIFFDVKIFVSSMDEALAYTMTYMVVNLMVQNYLYGHVRWPFMSELYEYVQGVYLAKAIVSVVVSPRSPTFNVTAKGLSLDEDHLSGLAWPFFAIFGVLAIGAATAFYRYFFEPGAELMLIVGLWTLFNLVVAGAALGVVAERREPDRFPRLAIQRQGRLTIGGKTILVDILSVSAGGCSLASHEHEALLAEAPVGAYSSLSVQPLEGQAAQAPLELDLIHKTSVDGALTLGFFFRAMKPASYMALADLMYGDPDAMPRFLAKRRKHMNLFKGSLKFLWWGVSEPCRAASYALRRLVVRPIGLPAVPQEVISNVVPLVFSSTDASQPPVVAAQATDRPQPVMASPAAEVISLLGARVSHPRVGIPEPETIATNVAFSFVTDLFAIPLEPVHEGDVSKPVQTAVISPPDWLRHIFALADHELSAARGEETDDVLSSVAA